MTTLIFDFDGTIADSFELVVEIAYTLLDLPIDKTLNLATKPVGVAHIIRS
jgi:phosphoglycolate phosphatase-like HAD superfamily hydrolase